MQSLIQYIFAAMIAWTPLQSLTSYGETVDQVRARYLAIASDIATGAMSPDEPPLFSGPSGRARTALLLASIGSFEGGWQRFVEEGDCNKDGFHADRRGNCDGGHAFTSWQIHVPHGGFLFVNGRLSNTIYASAYSKEHPDDVITGQKLLADRKLAIRVAEQLIRETSSRDCLLCGYSGESSHGAHPKADARLNRAKAYWASHPYVPAQNDGDARQASNP